MDLSLPFARPYRVRFDEAGPDGLVRPSTLVRYLQDLAWRHSESAGFDRGWYTARGFGWLVHGLELTGRRCTAGYGETVTVTHPYHGLAADVVPPAHGESCASDGGLVARARIDWVLLD